MARRETHPRLARRRSAISGWGVFTHDAISKNTRVIDYAGERISAADSVHREKRHLASGHIWCFAVNRRTVVDASVGGSVGRFINHSCRPNCYSRVVDGTIWICAARSIAAGEELSYRYHSDGAAKLNCRCRPGCKTVL